MMTPILTHPTPNTQAVTRAPRPAYTPVPATCHPDRPAWPVSETGLCHECEDRKFRAEMFAIGAKAAGFPNAREVAL